jgi:hypothetical protein
MTPTPPPRAHADVIPLFPNQASSTPRPRLSIPPALLRFLGGFRGLRVPSELATIGRELARKAVEFLAPALLLAVGAAMLALLAGSIALALGAHAVNPTAVAAKAGRWTLLATTGGALLRRGLSLARGRWG